MSKTIKHPRRRGLKANQTSPTLAKRIQEMAVHMAMMETGRKKIKTKAERYAHICPEQKFKLHISAEEFLKAKKTVGKKVKKKSKNKKVRKANPIRKKKHLRARPRKGRKASRSLAQLMRRYPRLFRRVRKSRSKKR